MMDSTVVDLTVLLATFAGYVTKGTTAQVRSTVIRMGWMAMVLSRHMADSEQS